MRQTSPEDSHTKGIVGRTNHLWAHQLREQIHENFHFHNGDLHATSPHRSKREAQAEEFERKLADYIRVQLQHEPLESQASYLKDFQETARLKNLSILGAACRDYISRSSLEAKSKVGKVKSMASDGSDDEQSRQVKHLRVL